MKIFIGALIPRIPKLVAIFAASLSLAIEARGQSSVIEELSALRTSLEKQGIQPALIYTAEGSAEFSGGERRGVNYLGNLHLQLTVDMNKLLGWPGATVFLDGLSIHGFDPSNLAGDIQGVSGNAGPTEWTLEEGWIQQNFFNNRFSMLAGRYDINSEFYRVHAADLFFNSSFGLGAEFAKTGPGLLGPSMFPDTALGIRVEGKPLESLILRVAILDGVPVDRPGGWNAFAPGDGWLLVGEVAYLYRPRQTDDSQPPPRRYLIGRNAGLPPYKAKLAVGVWRYTASFPDLSEVRANGSPVIHNGSSGGYVIGETTLYGDDAGREIRAFEQVGIADQRMNQFNLYIGAGVTAKGFVPNRKDDQFGFAVASARNGSHYMDAQSILGQPANRAETSLELAYMAQVKSWLTIEPDLQYVINPSTDPHRANALIGLVRFQLSF